MVCGLPKSVIQKYFYKFKVPLRYKDVDSLIKLCSVPNYDTTTFPSKYTPFSLIQTKRAFEECRKTEGVFTKAALEAESNLLEAAADMGDPTAISLLCASRMQPKSATADDMESGGKLLKQLMDSKFALAFKVSGDLAYTMGHSKEALRLYEMAIENDLNDDKLEVECFRNIGHIAFKDMQLIKAREAFSNACLLSGNTKQVSDCHYLLAQLREPDRIAARQHLEVAASFGLRDAFLPLASLLLNWFNEPLLAKQWFQLAESTDTTGAALIGSLDSSMRLKDNRGALEVMRRIRLRPDAESLLSYRRASIAKLDKPEPKKAVKTSSSSSSSTRWEF